MSIRGAAPVISATLTLSGTQEPMPFEDRHDFYLPLGANTVDDTVRPQKRLSNVVTAKLGNPASGERCGGQALRDRDEFHHPARGGDRVVS